MVIRDGAGQPRLMSCRSILHCTDADQAEALACLEGIRIGAKWSDRDFVLESDCVNVLNMIREKGINRSLVAPIILDVEKELVSLKSVEFVK